jgi:hypothetical protein
MATRVRVKSGVLSDVDEISGWITVKRASEIVGIQVESLSRIIYEQKFKAVRIAGIILCEKESVEAYAAERAKTLAEKKEKSSPLGQVMKMLEGLSPEEREKVLSQLNGSK